MVITPEENDINNLITTRKYACRGLEINIIPLKLSETTVTQFIKILDIVFSMYALNYEWAMLLDFYINIDQYLIHWLSL